MAAVPSAYWPFKDQWPFCSVLSLTRRFVGASGLRTAVRIHPSLTFLPIWGHINQRTWVEVEYGPCHLKHPQYLILSILNEPTSSPWVGLFSFPSQSNELQPPLLEIFVGSYINEVRPLNHKLSRCSTLHQRVLISSPCRTVLGGWCQSWSRGNSPSGWWSLQFGFIWNLTDCLKSWV